MRNSKVVIFDFDGTLADSSALIRKIYNEMAAEHGWPVVDEAEYQRLRGLKLSQVFQWVGVKSWQVPGFMREGLKRFRQHSADIELFPGTPELITKLAKAGRAQYVLSTNSPKTIKEVLDRYGVSGHLTILRRSALFGKDHAIRHLIAKQKYLAQNLWMVGDEIRDIEAAKRAGVKSAAVTWGLQDVSLLKAAMPDALATTPDALYSAFVSQTK